MNRYTVGIARLDEKLWLRFNGKPEIVVSYYRSLAEEVRKRMAELGVRSLGELRGWYDRLGTRSGMDAFLVVPISETRRVAPHQVPTDHSTALEDSLHFSNAIESQDEPQPIHNSDRSVGAGLSGELMRRRAQDRCLDQQITQTFIGSAVQSFCAFPAVRGAFSLCPHGHRQVLQSAFRG